MALELQLPKEFEVELFHSLKGIYKLAIEESKRDLGIIKEFLTLPEAMKFFNISRGTINSWIEDGVPVYIVGNKRYVKRTEINDYIESHRI